MKTEVTEYSDLPNLLQTELDCAKCFSPPSLLKVSEWANEHRMLSKEASSQGGKWRNLPMQIEPMDSVLDETVTSTCLIWSSQTAGKTELLLNIAAYFVHEDPSPILMIQPTLEMGEAWSKDRWDPMVRDTRCLRELTSNLSRKSSNTTLHKKFPGGHLTIAGANSPASLASRPIRIKLFDEIDRYPESAGKEGDPIGIAEKRSDTFWNDVSFKTSTPTIKNHSRIEKEWELSDKRYWFVQCPYCDGEQRLKWSQVKWDDDARLDRTYYECEKCKEQWSDLQRIAAVRAGRWIATAPFKGIRGYHLNGIYSLFRCKKGYVNRFHQMAAEFIDHRKKGRKSFQVWVNTFLAETWEEETDAKPAWSKLYERREQYPLTILGGPLEPPVVTVPRGVQYITFGTDFQADRIELEFVGWGPGEESWGLGHHVLYGDPKLPEMYVRLETLLIKEFIREDLARLTAQAGGFDTGYSACQRQLYAWLRPRLGRRYFAFKGSSQKDAEPISHSKRSKVEAVRLYMLGTNRLKSFLYGRASIAVPGPGFMHFPLEYSNTEWFKQLLAEDSKVETIQGSRVSLYYMPDVTPEGGTDRNEALDIRVYAHAALIARGGLNWELEERRNLLTIPSDKLAASLASVLRQPVSREASEDRQQRKTRVKRSGVLSGLKFRL